MSSLNIPGDSRIWVTGHGGLVGSAVVRALHRRGIEPLLASRSELDLRSQSQVERWMDRQRPTHIFHVGARVGGIYANTTLRGEFFYENLQIQSNVIHLAKQFGARKLIFVATNCTYPTNAALPLSEDSLLTGPLEPNVRSYAVAKLAGIEMCQAYRHQYGCDFVSVIPPNMYGPNDNFHPERSHVIAGIMGRMHAAFVDGCGEMEVWGDGSPRREILFSDDLAEAMLHVMTNETSHPVMNIGYGSDFTIAEIVEMLAQVIGFHGKIVYNTAKPNGSRGKLLDSSRIRRLGWVPLVAPLDGLRSAYQSYVERLPRLVS